MRCYSAALSIGLQLSSESGQYHISRCLEYRLQLGSFSSIKSPTKGSHGLPLFVARILKERRQELGEEFTLALSEVRMLEIDELIIDCGRLELLCWPVQ